MKKKLDKLDVIESQLTQVDKEITELKVSYMFVNDTTDELKQKQGSHEKLTANLNLRELQLEKSTPYLQDEIIDVVIYYFITLRIAENSGKGRKPPTGIRIACSSLNLDAEWFWRMHIRGNSSLYIAP